MATKETLLTVTGKNTHGVNAFREVRVRCALCGGKKITNMQCLTGTYLWPCNLCGEDTYHTVTETAPLKSAIGNRKS